MSAHHIGEASESFYRCSSITRYIFGESCNGITRIKAFALWFGFVFICISFFLIMAYGMKRIVSAWSSESNTLPEPTGSSNAPVPRTPPPPPNYSWSDRWGAFKWGGMARYQDLKAAVEADRMFKERVAKDGWDSVEIPIIRGFNCADARERERRELAELAKLPKGRDEEEAGGEGPGQAVPLDTIRSQRGGHLSPELSDEESDKQIIAKSFGKGSSNSRHGSSQRSSQRKRSRRKR